MSPALIDISVPLRDGMPTWPGSPGIRIRRHLDIEQGAGANASILTTDLHCGTHLDAPRHFLPEGHLVDEVSLDILVGPAEVVDVGAAERIDEALLESLEIPADVERLILKTTDSGGWATESNFRDDFVALTASGAEWVVDRQIKLVGIDYLSIQRFNDGPTTHLKLLGADIPILEGLELEHVKPGAYELWCLPIRIANVEAAPVRALLREIDQ